MGIKLDDQSGLTLLEVLLSIALLFIILGAFAGFFSQSAMFVAKNENKLTASQQAQQVVNLIESNMTKTDLSSFSSECGDNECVLENEQLAAFLGTPLDSSYVISAEFSPGVENLVEVEVSVAEREDPNFSSETFTYIRR